MFDPEVNGTKGQPKEIFWPAMENMLFACFAARL